jgi:hypothetical protein
MFPVFEYYQQTKRLKKTGSPLEWPFEELADGVSNSYDAKVLNVVYDTIENNRPRLSVILETEEDSLKFRDGPLGTFNEIDQRRVQERFESIIGKKQPPPFRIAGLLVIFVAFEPDARVEANGRVTEEEVDRLKAKLANEDLWKIHRLFDIVTFFFYTDAQVKQYEASGLKHMYADEYSRLVQAHDEFGYFKKRGVQVSFDSKENFDTTYQGNWFFYGR